MAMRYYVASETGTTHHDGCEGRGRLYICSQPNVSSQIISNQLGYYKCSIPVIKSRFLLCSSSFLSQTECKKKENLSLESYNHACFYFCSCLLLSAYSQDSTAARRRQRARAKSHLNSGAR